MNERNNDYNNEQSYDPKLKGTFFSVIFIGIFIILSWLGVFIFYWKAL